MADSFGDRKNVIRNGVRTANRSVAFAERMGQRSAPRSPTPRRLPTSRRVESKVPRLCASVKTWRPSTSPAGCAALIVAEKENCCGRWRRDWLRAIPGTEVCRGRRSEVIARIQFAVSQEVVSRAGRHWCRIDSSVDDRTAEAPVSARRLFVWTLNSQRIDRMCLCAASDDEAVVVGSVNQKSVWLVRLPPRFMTADCGLYERRAK